jgi:AraC family transcriptional regulator
MLNRIAYYVDGSPNPLTLPYLVPGSHGAWPGYVLERHDAPPNELPDCEFHGHLIVLERNPRPFRLSWKEDGRERSTDLGRGAVILRSQQPMRSARITGMQQGVMLNIDPRAMEFALPEPFRSRPVEFRPGGIGRDPVVNHMMAAIEAELKAQATGGQLVLTSLGNTLAVYLASRYAAYPVTAPAVRSGLSSDRLSRVLEYIDAHLPDDLTVDELAGIACLSSYHFGRMFKLSTGKSVHQFVLNRRIERSRALLSRKDRTLSEIAAAAGFGSQSRFTTVFRRATGATPGALRRELGR